MTDKNTNKPKKFVATDGTIHPSKNALKKYNKQLKKLKQKSLKKKKAIKESDLTPNV